MQILKHYFLVYFIFNVLFFSACVWNDTDDSSDFLPLDDSEYPYANLPRLVIETENFKEIRDKETKIPAKLQIWGKEAPESGVMNLTVKGHGNSSFRAMPKYSIKLNFENKYSLIGMPSDKEWILISNFADRTELRNYAIFKLANRLGALAPRCEFVEVYLNRNYIGIYLLIESIKVGKNRVNIPQNDSSFLFEKTTEYQASGEELRTERGTLFKIRYPKEVSEKNRENLYSYLNDLETALFLGKIDLVQINSRIDIDDYIRYFWLLEFSKNHDGKFGRSIFFTWETIDKIKMGPVWDYDETFGITKDGLPKESPNGWHAKNYGWNKPLFKNSLIWQKAGEYWRLNRNNFEMFIDSLDIYKQIVKNATNNEFKRWNILNNTEHWAFKEGYNDYDEAVDSLKSWAQARIEWINGEFLK